MFVVECGVRGDDQRLRFMIGSCCFGQGLHPGCVLGGSLWRKQGSSVDQGTCELRVSKSELRGVEGAVQSCCLIEV